MKTVITLIKREYWEQSSLFFKVPLALAVIITVAAFCGLMLALVMHGYPDNAMAALGDAHIQTDLRSLFQFSALPFVIVLWLTLFYYFVSTLYDDRKNRSVLFWQSMPISQAQTLLSKVVAGVVVAPCLAWVTLVLTQLILLIFATVFLWAHPLMAWQALWSPGQLMMMWAEAWLVMVVQALWLLPLFAWCLFWSAYAKKMPSLSALVSAVVLVVIEWMVFPVQYLGHFIGQRFAYAFSTWHLLDAHVGRDLVWSDYGMQLLLGLVVAVALMSAAAALRARCYDFDR